MTASINGQLCVFGIIDAIGIRDLIKTADQDGFGLSVEQEISFGKGYGTIYGDFDSEYPSDDIFNCLKRIGVSGEWCGYAKGRQKERIQVTMFDAPSGHIVEAHSFTDDDDGTIFLAPDASPQDIEIHAKWPHYLDLIGHKNHARLIVVQSQHDVLSRGLKDDIYPGSLDAYTAARAKRHSQD